MQDADVGESLASLLLGMSVAIGLLSGGAFDSRTQVIMLLCIAGFSLFKFRGVGLGNPSLWILVALLSVLGLAFAPAGLLPETLRASGLRSLLGTSASQTFSLQPWLSWDGWTQWLGFGVVGVLLLVRPVSEAERLFRARVLVGVVVAVAALGIAKKWVGFEPPWVVWLGDSGLKLFPNRNPFSTVLAVAGIAAMSCTHADLRRSRGSWWIWVAALVVLLAAIILNYSRGGIVLFFAGAGVWVVFLASSVSRGRNTGIMASFILLLLTLFFIFGGDVLLRFQGGSFSLPQDDWRVRLWSDAWSMIREAPWFGVGLGNFQALFPSYRSASVSQHVILHPESSLLLFGAESGLVGLGILVVGIAVLLYQIFPPGGVHQRSVRIAGVLSALMALAHVAFDVPGHTPAAVWSVLAFASLAAPSTEYQDKKTASARGGLCVIFALLVLAVGARCLFWVGQWQGVEQLRSIHAQAESHNASKRFHEAAQAADSGLRIAPLHWKLLYQRGMAGVFSREESSEVARYFRIAKEVETNLISIRWLEGVAWSRVGQWTRTLAAWREIFWVKGSWDHMVHIGLPGPTPEDYVRDMWNLTPQRYRGEIKNSVQSYPRAEIALLKRLPHDEFRQELEQLLERDPELASYPQNEKASLFSLWYERGDKERLIDSIKRNAEWLAVGWKWVAAWMAQQGDYQSAYAFILNRRSNTPWPQRDPSGLDADREAFLTRTDDMKVALNYALVLVASNRVSEAANVLPVIRRLGSPPSYFPWLEAHIWACQGKWQSAWDKIWPLI